MFGALYEFPDRVGGQANSDGLAVPRAQQGQDEANDGVLCVHVRVDGIYPPVLDDGEPVDREDATEGGWRLAADVQVPMDAVEDLGDGYAPVQPRRRGRRSE